ncbi:MAG: M10 family metallopeptidase C-terminal domain-containing protein, partial [Planktomarina sp.]
YNALTPLDNDLTGTLTFGDGSTLAVDLGDLSADLTHAPGNVGIAYGVTIENAIGGDGDDTIIGNGASNELSGGGGDDTLTGGAGADLFGFSVPTGGGSLGNDTITDFVVGTDLMYFENAGTVTGATSGADFVLTFNGGDTVTIQNVTSLTAGTDYEVF